MVEIIWEEMNEKLPWHKNDEELQMRKELWPQFDVNGNGYLSLAEVDKGMRDAVELPELFDIKPVLIRAFTKAKTMSKAKNEYGDDYVTKSEFRYGPDGRFRTNTGADVHRNGGACRAHAGAPT